MDRARHMIIHILLWLTAGCVIYALAGLLLGWRDFQLGLSRFPLDSLPLLIGLTLINYLLRFGRWSLYLRHLSLSVPTRESWALYFATFAMVVTPGKLGEVFKAIHLRERRRIPLAAGLSIIVAERLADILAIILLMAVGLFWWDGPLAGTTAKIAAASIIVLALASMRSGRLQRALVARLARAPKLRDHADNVRDSLNWLPRLTGGRAAVQSLTLSLLAWTAECLSLWLICERLGHDIGIGPAVFIYAAATLAGSLAFLPGGLGGTEAVLVVLLTRLDLPQGIALSVALLVRLVTLWLAVFIGVAVFLCARHILFPAAGKATHD